MQSSRVGSSTIAWVCIWVASRRSASGSANAAAWGGAAWGAGAARGVGGGVSGAGGGVFLVLGVVFFFSLVVSPMCSYFFFLVMAKKFNPGDGGKGDNGEPSHQNADTDL